MHSPYPDLKLPSLPSPRQIIMEAHGFAEVMPEHKFLIVDRIRHQGHVTGMTGDVS